MKTTTTTKSAGRVGENLGVTLVKKDRNAVDLPHPLLILIYPICPYNVRVGILFHINKVTLNRDPFQIIPHTFFFH